MTLFEKTYSRFLPDSLIRKLADETGVCEVPRDLTQMLRICSAIFDASNGAFNPFIGQTLVDMGYDERYSLKEAEHIASVPDFHETVRILDDTHIELRSKALMDLGALGKGYFVDMLAKDFDEKGIERYLINGSGDIRCKSPGAPLRAGLEHPHDASKVIGVTEIESGSLCASASNRRRWGSMHHEVNAKTLECTADISAAWVLCPNAALADALATCLFFTPPAALREACDFEYLILDAQMRATGSAGFKAEFF